ncbi:helix-turn-helix transcriptional regulator [Agromyces seonyuensis]|uniref:LuxR family transcriptional regulator n=1 Tax=Agromyces seonyuensis TaxID=2662446 RepID=A0A6I4NTC4_9MICO|nr:helix-turn-helix transcriptional regulator [Agromyces seonyuensis]MWB97473.1 LuxR family transcriptional regulator [Agromyces seonyuensis]
MSTAIAFARVRSDVDVLSRAGLPLLQFIDEASAALQQAVPFVAGCLSTLDPATTMVSSTRKLGALEERNDADVPWAKVEYGGLEPTAFTAMLAAGRTSVSVAQSTGGDLDRSPRMSEVVLPRFDFGDEARTVFAERSGAWGSLAMFRGAGEPDFDHDELALLAELAPAFARGLRTGLLAQHGGDRTESGGGPAVVIIDADDRIAASSPGAEAHLARMGLAPGGGDPRFIVHGLATGARRFARGESDRMPRIRARTADGVWLVLQAAPLGGGGERAGDVVVTIEEARPQEVLDLVADAFGLTARERDVVGAVLRGADTREIAASLHLSPYTVQDHLKSVFDKAGVGSRRELVARVYFDQYVPRAGNALGPAGWYTAGS